MIPFLSGAVAFGLLSALSWGSGDFCGGLATKRSSPFAVVFGVQVVGALLLALLALFSGESLPGPSVWGWASAAGVAVAVGLVCLYTGLAQGMMALVAPVSGVVGATVPIVVAAATEGFPGVAPMAGFALALFSVWLMAGGMSPSEKASAGNPVRNAERTKGLQLAVVAGLGFGLFFVLVDQATQEAIWWPLVIDRCAASLLLLPLVVKLSRQGRLAGALPSLPFVLLAGALDAGGNYFFGLAAQTGRLDTAAVLSSLYAAVTVGLAWFFLRERLTRAQWAGVVAALVAIPLIAA